MPYGLSTLNDSQHEMDGAEYNNGERIASLLLISRRVDFWRWLSAASLPDNDIGLHTLTV